MTSPIKVLLISLALALSVTASGFAGSEAVSNRLYHEDDAAMPSFTLSTESAYLMSILGNPNSYEIGAQFVTARWRWGANHNPNSFWHGFNQVYFLVLAEPMFRGIENYYYGISTGLRYNFVRLGSRFTPYISGGVGLGFLDSTEQHFSGQGQDFTFNVMSAAGVSYKLSDRWSGELGILYQHLSNAGQTDPNPSLNLIGPQIGVTYKW